MATQPPKKIEIKSMRLIVYKLMIFLLVAIYFKADHFFDMGKILEYLLIIFTCIAILGEILKLVEPAWLRSKERKRDPNEKMPDWYDEKEVMGNDKQ